MKRHLELSGYIGRRMRHTLRCLYQRGYKHFITYKNGELIKCLNLFYPEITKTFHVSIKLQFYYRSTF